MGLHFYFARHTPLCQSAEFSLRHFAQLYTCFVRSNGTPSSSPYIGERAASPRGKFCFFSFVFFGTNHLVRSFWLFRLFYFPGLVESSVLGSCRRHVFLFPLRSFVIGCDLPKRVPSCDRLCHQPLSPVFFILSHLLRSAGALSRQFFQLSGRRSFFGSRSWRYSVLSEVGVVSFSPLFLTLAVELHSFPRPFSFISQSVRRSRYCLE